MRKLQLLTTFFFLIGTSTSVSAQNKDIGNWIVYVGNMKITDKLSWQHDIQYRNYNLLGDMEQLLLRSGIGYNLTPGNNNALLGYAFIRNETYTDSSDNKAITNENRTYQQFLTKQKAGRVALQHRYRLEQRWVEEDFSMRFRYLVGLNVPLNNKTLTDKTIYASAYNEVFINDRGTLFSRNRLYGGAGYKLNDQLRLELGYLNRYIDKSARHQANIFVFVSF